MSDIRAWLADLDLSQYGEAFEENEITIDLLGELDQDVLKEIGVGALGHRLKILKAARHLAPPPAPVAAPPPKTANEERRQLTIQFCDLVGSTQISSRMDPEDYRELMRVYQETASNVILRYGGYVAQYLGDGLMTFFGYPLAQEDAAERAVRSALEIVAAVTAKSPYLGEHMKVRIGIATGTVVVGDIVGQRVFQTSAASGETTNLAARLQGVAGENMVVISGDTKRLMRSPFQFESLGEKVLKGISQPVTAWHVVGEQAQASATVASAGAQLVGRADELASMLNSWAAAQDGRGRVTLLEGEAGLGKSRLLQEYCDRTGPDDKFRLTFQCSSFFTDTAFHPLRRNLEHEAHIVSDDDAETRVDKLIATLTSVSGETAAENYGALFASVLSLPLDRFPPMQLSPGLQKRKTIEALSQQVIDLAARRPVQILFEDAHWADPTTLDAVSAFIDRIADLNAHIIITHRPEFQPPWAVGEMIEKLTLRRLGGDDVLEIIAATAGLETLTDAVRQQIADRTDGIPLFAQELARSFAEGLETGEDESATAVPATLQDSLMARLDRLGSAREAAQLAAVIGREFELDLLQAISGWPAETVRLTLSQLEAADLIDPDEDGLDASWHFRHALLQDAAYDSILRRRRRALHETIAQTIVDRFPDRAGREPEYVAHHFTEAELPQDAATHWLAAGRIAWGRAAATEALALLDRGLKQAVMVEDPVAAAKLELQFQSLIGVVHFAATSYASPEAHTAFARARELCDIVDDPDLQMTVLYGLGTYETMRGDVHAGHQTFVQLSNVADDVGLPRYDVMSASLLTWSYFNRGHYRSAVEYGERTRDLYAQGAWANTGARTNAADPRVVSDAFLAVSQWVLGKPSLAEQTAGEVLDYAKALNDPYSLAYAYTNSSIRAIDMIEDWPTLLDRAEKGIELSDSLGYFYLSAYCNFWRSRALSEMGRNKEAARQSDECMAVISKLGIGYHKATYNAKHAKMLAIAGHRDRALGLVKEAPDLVTQSGEFSQESEVLVLTGDFHLICGDQELAKRSFAAAARVAIAREERSWELRGVLKQARILAENGDKALAGDLLRPVYEAYPDKAGKGDPQAAGDLLGAL